MTASIMTKIGTFDSRGSDYVIQDTTMKERIEAAIREIGPGVSFVELAQKVVGFQGEFAWEVGDTNVICWHALSKDAIESIRSLIDEGKIEVSVTSPLTYHLDGLAPMLPVAKRLGAYKEPHWLPMCFKLGGLPKPRCGICHKEFKPEERVTVREAWLLAGGCGVAPDSARVHRACDNRERARLAVGTVKVSDIYRREKA